MGIWSRLGTVIKSYLDDDINVFRSEGRHSSADPDLDAAFEELDGFLNGRKEKPAGNDGAFSAGAHERSKLPPEELRPPPERMSAQSCRPKNCAPVSLSWECPSEPRRKNARQLTRNS